MYEQKEFEPQIDRVDLRDVRLMRLEARNAFVTLQDDPQITAAKAVQAVTDMAGFGYEGDISNARKFLKGLMDNVPPAKLTDDDAVSSLEKHIYAARDVGGVYLDEVDEAVRLVPTSINNPIPEKMLVELAHSGDSVILDGALRAVSAYGARGGNEYDQAKLLVALHRLGVTEVEPYVLSLTQGFQLPEAVGVLIPTRGMPFSDTALAESTARIESINWDDLDAAIDDRSKSPERNLYVTALAKVYRANQDDTNGARLQYFAAELPPSISTAILLAENADVITDAPQMISNMLSETGDPLHTQSNRRLYVVEAYSRQQNFEAAVKLAEVIPEKSIKFLAYRLIVSRGGIDYISNMIQAMSNPSAQLGKDLVESNLADAVTDLVEAGHLRSAHEVTRAMTDLTGKIHALRKIVRATERQPLY